MSNASSTKPRISRTTKAAGAAGLAGALILAGSMAYFTDRQTAEVSATAGTVDVGLTEAWADVSNFNPGDMADMSYTISNDGNKSVDIRETIVVKSSVAMNAADQAEFEIYKAEDVKELVNGSHVPEEDAEPIATGENRIVSADGKTIQYKIDEYTLNGTGENAEQEDGITAVENKSDYVLVFKETSGNAFQGSELSVELLAEAKQHRNTDGDTWSVVATDSISIGGQDLNAVPER